MSNSLRPHRLQHTRLPCPSLSPGIFSGSCPLSQLCHPTISSSVACFSLCLQFFPISGLFPELALRIKGPKHWNFNFSLSPSNENSGLTSFRIEKSNNFSFLIVSSQMDNHYYIRKHELTTYWDKGSPQVKSNKASVEGQICFSSNSKGPHSLMQGF